MSPGAMSVSTPAPSDITQRRLGHCMQAGVHTHVREHVRVHAHVRLCTSRQHQCDQQGEANTAPRRRGTRTRLQVGAKARAHSFWQVPAPYLVQQAWWGVPDRGKGDPGPVGLCHAACVHNWHAPLLQQLEIYRLVGPLCAETPSMLSVSCAGCCWQQSLREWVLLFPPSHTVCCCVTANSARTCVDHRAAIDVRFRHRTGCYTTLQGPGKAAARKFRSDQQHFATAKWIYTNGFKYIFTIHQVRYHTRLHNPDRPQPIKLPLLLLLPLPPQAQRCCGLSSAAATRASRSSGAIHVLLLVSRS